MNAAAAGTHTLSFRYVNGSSDRPLELRVNGTVVKSPMSFPPTGSWQTWKTASIEVALPAGTNKVRLTTMGANGPNVDSLTVTPPAGTMPTDPPPTDPPPTEPPAGNLFEAESAARSGPAVDNSIKGYTGSGFVDYGSSSGWSGR